MCAIRKLRYTRYKLQRFCFGKAVSIAHNALRVFPPKHKIVGLKIFGVKHGFVGCTAFCTCCKCLKRVHSFARCFCGSFRALCKAPKRKYHNAARFYLCTKLCKHVCPQCRAWYVVHKAKAHEHISPVRKARKRGRAFKRAAQNIVCVECYVWYGLCLRVLFFRIAHCYIAHSRYSAYGKFGLLIYANV